MFLRAAPLFSYGIKHILKKFAPRLGKKESRPGVSPNSLGNNEHSGKALWPRENHTFEGGSPVFSRKVYILKWSIFVVSAFSTFFSGKCSFWSALLGGTPVFLREKGTFSFIFFYFRSFSFIFFFSFMLPSRAVPYT